MADKIWKEAFVALKANLPDSMIVIEFESTVGFTMVDFVTTSKSIFINTNYDYDEKLFILCHELGHFYKVKGDILKPSKRIANEKNSNITALKLLCQMGLDCCDEYMAFYKKHAKVK